MAGNGQQVASYSIERQLEGRNIRKDNSLEVWTCAEKIPGKKQAVWRHHVLDSKEMRRSRAQICAEQGICAFREVTHFFL